MKIHCRPVPEGSLISRWLPGDYADAFETPLTGEVTPDDLQIAFWSSEPGWVQVLFRLRDVLVKPFGLQGTERNITKLEACIRESGSYGLVSVVGKSADETVIALTDKHLVAYMSMLIVENDGKRRVCLSTVVDYRSGLGRAYFFVVRPFHRIVTSAMLRRMLRSIGNGENK